MCNVGSISSMNTTLKNNRKSLPSKRQYLKKEYVEYTKSGQSLRVKKVDPQELEKIKQDIVDRKQREKRRFRTVLISTLSILVSVGTFCWIYFNV